MRIKNTHMTEKRDKRKNTRAKISVSPQSYKMTAFAIKRHSAKQNRLALRIRT